MVCAPLALVYKPLEYPLYPLSQSYFSLRSNPQSPQEPWPDVTRKYAAKTSLDAPGSTSCEFTRTLDKLWSLHSTLSGPNVTVTTRGLVIEPGAQLYEGGNVTILFPYRSILLIVHSRHLLTWRDRGSVCFLNTTYLLVHSSSTFSLVSLSLDVLIS